MPFVARWIALRRLRAYLVSCSRVWEGRDVVIFAHGFGAWLTAHALRGAKAKLKYRVRLILCGSVLSRGFFSQGLAGAAGLVDFVVNECGLRDWWPVVAGLLVIGMGTAGRRGLVGPLGAAAGIVNRYFKEAGHSGFFDTEFMTANRLPLLDGFRDLSPVGGSLVPPDPGPLAWLESIATPFKIALISDLFMGTGAGRGSSIVPQSSVKNLKGASFIRALADRVPGQYASLRTGTSRRTG